MAVNRIYTRTGTQASPGTKIDADIDNTNTYINAHEVDSTAVHGVGGTLVGTTDTQTLSAKTLAAPTISTGIKELSLNREEITTTANVAASTVIVSIVTIAASYTITLLTSQITGQAGRIWIFKDETGACGNAYNITIVGEGGETIDNQASYVMCSNYEALMLYSDGAKLWTKPY